MSNEELLALIRKRKSIRRYSEKIIPNNELNKILQAGRWGPSVLGIQSWEFVLIINKDLKKKLAQLLLQSSLKSNVGVNLLLKAAAKNVDGCHAVMCVYSTREIQQLSRRFSCGYLKYAKMAEIASAAACIQNMILVAQTLNIGVCWHDIPLFCEKSINQILGEKNSLLAVLTLGYPAEKGKRSPRKSSSKIIRCIK